MGRLLNIARRGKSQDDLADHDTTDLLVVDASAKEAKKAKEVPNDSWEWIEERASILQYEAGLSRSDAESQAFALWFERFVAP